MAARRPVRLVQSEVWLGRAEFDDLIRQREPAAGEAARYPGAGTRDIEVRPLIMKPSRVSPVAPLFSPAPTIVEEPLVEQPLVEEDGLIRLDDLEPAATGASSRPAPGKSRRCTRWAAAGLLGAVVLGGAVSVPLLTFGGGAPRVSAGKAAPVGPVVVIPAADPVGRPGSKPSEAVQPAPVAAPKPPAAVTVRSETAATPASPAARSDHRNTTRPQRPSAATTPAPDNQAAMDEAYRWWSEAATYGARNPRWTQFGPESAPLASANWDVEPGRQSHR